MINLKKLRSNLEKFSGITDTKRINIKRKRKMILEQIPNGDIKLKRRSVIKIEIIE